MESRLNKLSNLQENQSEFAKELQGSSPLLFCIKTSTGISRTNTHSNLP